jgi:hypothetical protein
MRQGSLHRTVVALQGTALLLLFVMFTGCAGGPSALERKADALMRHGMARDAVRLVRAEIVRLPGDARLHELLGRAQLALGDDVAADSAFREACTLDTSYVAVMVSDYVREGSARLSSGDLGRARPLFEWALTAEPQAAARIADSCLAAGTRLVARAPDQAEDVFNVASSMSPEAAPKIGRAWLEDARRVVAADPGRGEADLDRAVGWAPDLSAEAGKLVATAMQRGDPALRERLAALVDRYGNSGQSGFVEASGRSRTQRQIMVSAAGGWISSGFEVAAGDTLRFEPSGTVRAEARRDGWVSDPCGPAGWPARSMEWLETATKTLPLPRSPRMALIARLAGTGPFAVPGAMRFVAPQNGRLEFAVNEFPDKLGAAAGAFKVLVDAPMSALRQNVAGAAASQGR